MCCLRIAKRRKLADVIEQPDAETWEVPVGEAKARLAELRTRMIVELERWMTPTSAEEDRLNDAIRALTFYKIQRVPDDQLTYMKMEPQQCHLNASAYAKLDPTGESQHVSGWWKRGGIFFFHSVILTRTRLSCVTPHHDPSPLQFAPDFDIKWMESNGLMNASRDGLKVPFLVRDFPETVIAEATAARDALLAGADPRSIQLPL
jgi:hypothetical protein